MPAMSTSFNRTIGAKIRCIRKLKGLTQQKLAESIGVSFQQLQKYETGVNTLSFERVCTLSRLLDVPLMHWVEAPEEPEGSMPAHPRQELGLLRSYHAIAREEHRRLLCATARAFAGLGEEE